MKATWLITKDMPIDFFMKLSDRFDFFIEQDFVVMIER